MKTSEAPLDPNKDEGLDANAEKTKYMFMSRYYNAQQVKTQIQLTKPSKKMY
jgi:hypothetical protein